MQDGVGLSPIWYVTSNVCETHRSPYGCCRPPPCCHRPLRSQAHRLLASSFFRSPYSLFPGLSSVDSARHSPRCLVSGLFLSLTVSARRPPGCLFPGSFFLGCKQARRPLRVRFPARRPPRCFVLRPVVLLSASFIGCLRLVTPCFPLSLILQSIRLLAVALTNGGFPL